MLIAARSHNRSPRLARRSAGNAAGEHTLVPTKQLPLPVHECPSQRKAHKALPKTSITRFATKSGEARDVACLAHDQEVQFARNPLEEFPEPFASITGRMKGDVINEFCFGHPPRIIFVKDVGLVVKVVVELIQATSIERLRPVPKHLTQGGLGRLMFHVGTPYRLRPYLAFAAHAQYRYICAADCLALSFTRPTRRAVLSPP